MTRGLESVLLPSIVCAPAVMTKLALAPTSGIVCVRELVAGVGALSVIVRPEPKTNWLLVGVMASELDSVLDPLRICAPSVITKCASIDTSGIVCTREIAGVGAVMVVVCVVPKTSWFVASVSACAANVGRADA